MKFGNIVYSLFIVCVTSSWINAEEEATCDVPTFRHCFHELLQSTVTAVTPNDRNDVVCSASNFTSNTDCTLTHLDRCSSQLGPVRTDAVRPYVRMLETVYGKACSNDFPSSSDCDLYTAETCIKEFIEVISQGHLIQICRQIEPTLQCLSPALDTCTNLPRYMVAMVTDEVTLTSDVLCNQGDCSIDVAQQCLQDAITMLDYPVTIVTQSPLICGQMRSSIACITNHTSGCAQVDIPAYLTTNYWHIYQFTAAYCPVVADDTMLMNIPSDLVSSVVLATIATNSWASVHDICSLFNKTIVQAAMQGQQITTYTENLLTWQYAMNLNIDKYSDVCFMPQTQPCNWLVKQANENPVCDVPMAARCVDMVLLSKLTVEVNLYRRTWQSVCSIAYNMLACIQYNTGACSSDLDRSPMMQQIQEVEGLLGYECSQLGAGSSPNDCIVPEPKCKVSRGIENCDKIIRGNQDICLDTEELYICLQEQTSDCNSVQVTPAQFYLEYELGIAGCTHNTSLLTEDALLGVAQCKLQFGYNVNNGLVKSADFQGVVCAAVTLLEQCISSQMIPSLARYYMGQYTQHMAGVTNYVCNTTAGNNVVNNNAEESTLCDVNGLSGAISGLLLMITNIPFNSIKEQEHICSTQQDVKDFLITTSPNCSSAIQDMLRSTVTLLDSMYTPYCHLPARPQGQGSCDMFKVKQCLEDFGSYTYFTQPDNDHCRKLNDTYNCLYEHSTGCNNNTHDALLQEVKAMHSLVGNVTCPRMPWCDDEVTTSHAWLREICMASDEDSNTCQMFEWQTCIENYGLEISCINIEQAKVCLESQLAGCDPLQFLHVKDEMTNYINQNSFCNLIIPDTPDTVTQEHTALYQCSYLISQSGDMTKAGLCSSIGQFIQCLANQQSALPFVWQGVMERSYLIWEKYLYLDCQISGGNEFLVNADFDTSAYNSGVCESLDSQYCLRSLTHVAVTYFYLIPLTERHTVACQQRADSLRECVFTKTAGCTSPAERSMLTSGQWLTEAMDNIGVCSTDKSEQRHCNPKAALHCISDLASSVADNKDGLSKKVACSKLISTNLCVSKETSSCDFQTRMAIETSLQQTTTIVKQVCSPVAPPTSSTDTCMPGEITLCDLEEALICMAPVQALLMQADVTNINQVCSLIPAMKACIHRQTSGCDEVTAGRMSERVHRLSHRLGDQCPQIYCEECQARQCLTTLYQTLQYDGVNLCSALSETKLCIYDNAQYCDISISENLLREMAAFVGTDGQICEITLPACLQTLMNTAFQILNYETDVTLTSLNMTSTQTDLVFQYMCTEAGEAHTCVQYHLGSMEESDRWQVMNGTLREIAHIVSDKCQGITDQLQCYSCVNATSNDDCNQQSAQTCAPDRQMCGTVLTPNSISKGCVAPNLCQTGCIGDSCFMCCVDNLCNQPWNNILIEPATCRPMEALWCGFQLLSSLSQNDTIDCSLLQEAISCMTETTHDCISLDSQILGSYARDLMTGDVISTCMAGYNMCSCGQCSSMIILSLISSPYSDVDTFCGALSHMYNQTVSEMNFDLCNQATLQSTAYNLNLASYLTQGVCFMEQDENECSYDNRQYSHGASFLASDGCNRCNCNGGAVACTLMFCPPDESPKCQPVPPGQVGPCVEECSTDTQCNDGQLCCSNGCGHTCQLPSKPEESTCIYGNLTYGAGDSFIALDGCNQCMCVAGGVGCTRMYCPPNNQTDIDRPTPDATCDILGVQQCIQTANLPYLLSVATYSDAPYICRAAFNMLTCVNSKVMTCDVNMVDVVRQVVWMTLTPTLSICNYNNGQGGDVTPEPWLPDTDNDCYRGPVHCYNTTTTTMGCGEYKVQFECIEGHMRKCLSVQTVADLYELQHTLAHVHTMCNMDIPQPNNDPFYPIANCTMQFATSLDVEMMLDYLGSGHGVGLCDHIHQYTLCLQGAELSPMVRMYVSNMVQSVSYMAELCYSHFDGDTDSTDNSGDGGDGGDGGFTGYPGSEHSHCHQCEGYTSIEECDRQSTQNCYGNQMCSTILQLDMTSGVTLVTKGCADLVWCQSWHGCSAQHAACVQCCYGDMCNSAVNMTSLATTADPITSRPVTMTTRHPLTTTVRSRTTTSRPATTRPPYRTTTHHESHCNLNEVSTFMMAHSLRLLNFNFVPVQHRQYICGNFESNLAAILNNMNSDECSREVTEHVQTVSQWLSSWTGSLCEQLQQDTVQSEKCMHSLTCVTNMTTFTDQNSTCRSIEESVTCLKDHYPECNSQWQASINRTIQLLQEMDYVACEKNKLLSDREPTCVNMTGGQDMSDMCNVTRAMECVTYIQKAMYNPFMEQQGYCRLSKVGLQCIYENLRNCSEVVTRQLTSVVMEIEHVTFDLCPDTWCPVSDRCRLDKARECIGQLQQTVLQMMYYDQMDRTVCTNVTKVHHCVMEMTEECYHSDRQTVIQEFSVVASVVTSLCSEPAINLTLCYQHFHVGLDQLLNINTDFTKNLMYSLLQQVTLNNLISNATLMLDDLSEFLMQNMAVRGYGINLPGGYKGINLPGGYSSNSTGSGGWFGGGYGLNLPGGYRKRRAAESNTTNTTATDNNIFSNNTDLWNDENKNSTTNKTSSANGTESSGRSDDNNKSVQNESSMNKFTIENMLSALNLTKQQFESLLNVQTLMHLSQHKMMLCDSIHESLMCLHGNQAPRSLPGQQEFVTATTLQLLGDLALSICQPQQCHRCNNLHSNKECNDQPMAVCDPLQSCITEVTQDGHFYKGCHSSMTCEDYCQQSEGTCYCCHGNICNKHSDVLEGRCDINSAVNCVQDLLYSSLDTQPWNRTLLHTAAMCMTQSTRGCHVDTAVNFYREGERILKLLEYNNCSEGYGPSFCDLPGAVTLSFVFKSSYRTTSSVTKICKLFNSTMAAYNKTMTRTCCQNNTAVKVSFISIYKEIKPYCVNLNARPICGTHSNCSRNSINRTTGNDVNNTGSDVIEGFCTELKNANHTSLEPVNAICNQTVCNVTHGIMMFKELGYIFGTASVDNHVFCSKTENVFLRIQCHMAPCGVDELYGLKDELLYMLPAVSARCPQLAHTVYCDSRLTLLYAGNDQEEITCTYGNVTFSEGDGFVAVDGCNRCKCSANGVACTRRLCPSDNNQTGPFGPGPFGSDPETTTSNGGSSTRIRFTTPAPTNQPTRQTTREPTSSSRTPPETVYTTVRPFTTTNVDGQGTDHHGDQAGSQCNIVGAQMCLYIVSLPQKQDGEFCSKMTSVMEPLSDCIMGYITHCDAYEQSEIQLYYNEVLSEHEEICDKLFSDSIFMRHTDGQCRVPTCGFLRGEECIYKLSPLSASQNCGNLEQVVRCMNLETAGCHDLQKQTLMVLLKGTVAAFQMPPTCIDKVAMVTINQSAPGMNIFKCLDTYRQNISYMMTENLLGYSNTCDLYRSLMMCYSTELASDNIPVVMAESLMHLVKVVTPTLNTLCNIKDKYPEANSTKTPILEECKMAALSCFEGVSYASLLAPVFTQDGQKIVCDYLDGGRACIAGAMTRCPKALTDVMSIINMIQTLGQLSGTCSPKPVMCEAGEAIDCITDMAGQLEMYGTSLHQADICRSIYATKHCIKQTTTGCRQSVKDSVMDIFQPISCKAYTICPMAVELTEMVREPMENCVSSSAMVHGGTCNPSQALYCIQDFYGDMADPLTVNMEPICRSYTDTLKCFFNNLNACEDDLTIMVAMNFIVDITNQMGPNCHVTIKPVCDDDDHQMPGCNLDQIDMCINTFKAVKEMGNQKATCYAIKAAERCFDSYTESCDRMTQLFAKVKLQGQIHGNTDLDLCNDLQQCSYNYAALMTETLALTDQGHMSDQDHMEAYHLCSERLDELQCIQSQLSKLPQDVAMVTVNVLNHLEALFGDFCGEMLGLRANIPCDSECMNCTLQGYNLHTYLPILLSFVEGSMNGSQVHSSYNFCGMYDTWMATYISYMAETASSCPGNNVTMTWHEDHVTGMSGLYDTYCHMPCNVSMAETCVLTLETGLTSVTDTELACSLYEVTLSCIDSSVTSCEVEVTNRYVVLAQSIFQNTSIRCYTMPKLEINVPSVMELIEGGDALNIDVAMVTTLGDSCQGNSCQVEVVITMDEMTNSSCASGETISQIVLDHCSVYFSDGDVDTCRSFSLMTRIDHSMEDDFMSNVTLVARLWEDGVVVAREELVTMVMVVKDVETGGVCMAVNQPQILTFDGLYYDSFRQGEHVLYQHDTLPQKVHVGFQRCSLFSITTCPCVVMVTSWADTFILDTCRRSFELSHPLEFKVIQNNDVSTTAKVYTSVNSKLFQFVLPTGTIVSVQASGSMLDVWIKPSALDWGETTGLCGTYDGDQNNDFTWPDGIVQSPEDVTKLLGNLYPSDFLNAWRAPESLFSGTTEGLTIPLLNTTACSCTGPAGVCMTVDLVVTCDLVQGTRIQGNDLVKYLQDGGQVIARKRRQATDPWADIDAEDGYEPDLPSWPTTSGQTEADSIVFCETSIMSSALWDVCSVAVDTSGVMSSCVTDILLQDGTDNVGASLEMFKVMCKLAVQSDPSIAVGLNTTSQALLSYILGVSCVNDCSGNGQCVVDVCTCEDGYVGLDCSFILTTAPSVSALSEVLYTPPTSTTSLDVTQQVYVYGDNFINSDKLSCHFDRIQLSSDGYISSGVDGIISPATFLTFGSVSCDLTGTLPLTGWLVSVSNDGRNQSNGLLYIIQDSVCYNCDPVLGVCNLQPTSCVIDNQCYQAGAYNPADTCYVCDPVTNVWKYKTSSNCPVLSSTTQPTSSTNTTSISTQSTSSQSPSSSSTSSTTSSSTRTTPRSVTTPTTPRVTPTTDRPGSGGDNEGQNQDDNEDDTDQQTLYIIIGVGAVVGVVVVVGVVCMAIRGRRHESRSGSTASSEIYRDPRPSAQQQQQQQQRANAPVRGGNELQGRNNVTFNDDEENPGEVRRDAPFRSAPFNPQGLMGDQPLGSEDPRASGDNDGMYRVNIGIFDGEVKSRSEYAAEGQGQAKENGEYSGIEKTFNLPRPVAEESGANIYDNAGAESPQRARAVYDVYDNAPVVHTNPRPDYDEVSESGSSTRL